MQLSLMPEPVTAVPDLSPIPGHYLTMRGGQVLRLPYLDEVTRQIESVLSGGTVEWPELYDLLVHDGNFDLITRHLIMLEHTGRITKLRLGTQITYEWMHHPIRREA